LSFLVRLWRGRLWPAVLLPALLAISVLSVLLLMSALFLLARQDDLRTSQATHITLDLLGYSAESLAFRGSLQRVVSFVGTEDAIDAIVVVAGEPRVVVASTRLEEVGDLLEEVRDSRLRVHLQDVARAQSGSADRIDARVAGDDHTYVRPINLRLTDGIGRRYVDGEVGVRVNVDALGGLPGQLVATLVAATMAGLVAAMLSLTWVLRRRILRPLESIIRTMNRRATGKGTERFSVPYPDEFATVAAEINASIDSIDRQKAELEQLALIARFTSDMVVIARPDRTIDWVNDGFVKLLGHPRERCVGRRLRDLVKVSSNDLQMITRFWDTIDQGKSYGGEAVFYSRDGREVQTRFSGWPVLDRNGQTRQVVIIATDMTESRLMQREINAGAAALREDVAYALHDTLGGDLGGLSFRSKLLAERLASEGRPEAELAEELTVALNEISGRTRTLSHLMAPTSAVLGGLDVALVRLCDAVRSGFNGVNCTLRVRGSAYELDDWEETQVFLVVQEAVRNSVTHGMPTMIAVTLHATETRLRVQVTNNGAAWDPSLPANGLGLRAMRYRASLMNAGLWVRVRPAARITSVRCMVPLRSKSTRAPGATATGDGALSG
jgi:two-component system, NarL family, sensor histidine kinase NreB